MEIIQAPFPWYLSGFLIGLVMLILVYWGKTFGMSTNLKTMCGLLGADKISSFFSDWQSQKWNLLVALGTILGGFVAAQFLDNGTGIQISQSTIDLLQTYGIEAPNGQYIPNSVFGLEALSNVKTILLLLVGGIFIGFGTRYAGGCTSGHAIMGLSDLQWPSLVATICFMIGGFIMANFILPFILHL